MIWTPDDGEPWLLQRRRPRIPRARPTSTMLMSHVRALREEFANLASSGGKVAAGSFKKRASRTGDLAETALDRVSNYRDALTEKVKDHPLASIGIAVLAGIIVSSMRRR